MVDIYDSRKESNWHLICVFIDSSVTRGLKTNVTQLNSQFDLKCIWKKLVVKFNILTFFIPCCVFRFDFRPRKKTMFGSSLPPAVSWSVHDLFSLFVYDCEQWCPTHVELCFFVLCALFCRFLWIVHLVLPQRYSLTFI